VTDRPPVTRGAQIFGKVAAVVVLGGGLLLTLLIIIWVAVQIIRGI
jgi:hypothetical protein